MRKLLSLLLASILLCTLAIPAGASDYMTTAMAYLTGKYGVKPAQVQLFEGGVTNLEYTRESFWMAKYIIAGKASTTSTAEKPLILIAPEGKPEPALTPAPSNEIHGAVYVHLKSGKVLGLDEMEIYYRAEMELAEREWNRLRAEAGKLDVPLYQRLKTAAKDEKINVVIVPSRVETPEVRAKFADIKKKYPQFAEHLTLLDVLTNSNGGSIHGRMPMVGTDGIKDLPLSDGAVATTPATRPAPDQKITDEYYQQYEAFWQELTALMALAEGPSVKQIVTGLPSINIVFADTTTLSAELTPAQIRLVADFSAVEAVYEYMAVTTDAIAYTTELLSSKASDHVLAAPESTDTSSSKNNTKPLAALAGALVFSLALLVKKTKAI